MRTFGLDVHKRFAEVAVIEDGEIRQVGRIENGELEAFALTLSAEDHVVLESTALTWPIAELLGRHAGKVTVSNPMRTKAIASAKVKTDKVDAKVLAQLGAADFLPEVWAPDEITRVLRRRIAHRQGLVRQRNALRNQVHAILDRNLICADWATDLFGHKGRRGLAGVELPDHERAALECSLRLHDVLAEEIERAEQALAGEAFTREQVRRLMTIPFPRVIARTRHAEHAAHGLDRVLGLLRRDEPEDHRRVSLSLAKKAAAFLRISRSSASVRTSRRSRRSSSRSSEVKPSALPSSTSS